MSLEFLASVTPNIFFYVAIINALLGFAAIIVLVAALTKPYFWNVLKKWIWKRADSLSLLIALLSTLGSLWLSDIAGITPCKLCWFQRIFMYPIVIILGVSLWKKLNVRYIVIVMSLFGGLIAAYHYAIQRLSFLSNSVGCQADASCSAMYLGYWGWYSIPLFALVAFFSIFVLQLLRKR